MHEDNQPSTFRTTLRLPGVSSKFHSPFVAHGICSVLNKRSIMSE